jgi:hypothetical protein
MFRTAIIALVALSLTGCGMFDTLAEGMKHSRAVETDLEQKVGMRPQVGFNWSNGRLVAVTVTFPHLYEKTPLHELANVVRRSVAAQFQQTPETINLAFALGKSDDTVARIE